MIAQACLQCGTPAASAAATFCRRCGLPYGAPPREDAPLPACPICYRDVGDDGRLPSVEQHGRRLDLQAHIAEHERHPVGDDDLLESLRQGDLIRIDRWTAPFDVVRRYFVTGSVDGGRRRSYEHNAIVNAMTQLRRWGVDAGTQIFGDQAEWQAARAAVSALMERYHHRRTH
jgi:hypothetical protein